MRWIICLAAVMALTATAVGATVTIGFDDPSQDFIDGRYIESGFSMVGLELIGPGEDMLPPSVPIPATSIFAGVELATLQSLDNSLFTLNSIDVAPASLPSVVLGYSLALGYYPSQFSSEGVTYYNAPYPDRLGWSTLTLPDIEAARIFFFGVYCGVGCGGDPAYIDNLVIAPEEGAAPVPESPTWVVMIAGLLGLGLALRLNLHASSCRPATQNHPA